MVFIVMITTHVYNIKEKYAKLEISIERIRLVVKFTLTNPKPLVKIRGDSLGRILLRKNGFRTLDDRGWLAPLFLLAVRQT